MYTYPIDYDQFTNQEIVEIVEFLALIEDANTTKVNPDVLVKKHQKFRKIINSIAMEKQIDRDFQKASGYSIYQTMKRYL